LLINRIANLSIVASARRETRPRGFLALRQFWRPSATGCRGFRRTPKSLVLVKFLCDPQSHRERDLRLTDIAPTW